jgi:hypothetical protein
VEGRDVFHGVRVGVAAWRDLDVEEKEGCNSEGVMVDEKGGDFEKRGCLWLMWLFGYEAAGFG